jgi:hypothetical protein
MLSRWYAWPLTGCLALNLPAAHAAASAPEDLAVQIRFYPVRNLHVYEVDARHGLSGALLHNVAIVNDSDSTVLFEKVELELCSSGAVTQTHRLLQTDLERSIQKGLALKKSGLLEKFAFQFRPEILLGPGVALAGAVCAGMARRESRKLIESFWGGRRPFVDLAALDVGRPLRRAARAAGCINVKARRMRITILGRLGGSSWMRSSFASPHLTSILQIASSSASRSRMISELSSGGFTRRRCATSNAVRARS